MLGHQNEYKDVVSEIFIVDENVTSQLLGPCNNSLNSEPIELLLATLFYSFEKTFTDRGLPQVFNEGHSRNA